jgi:L-lactate utilization protein LutB
MNDTLETNEQHAIFPMGGFTLDFCMKLERERNEARADLQYLKEQLDYVRKQRDKMVDDLDQLVLTVSDIRDARGMT